MTAINVCVAPDGVHLFTDAGHMEIGKNSVEAIANKVALVPEYGAAIAANGFAFVEKVITATLAQTTFADFDALAAGFTGLIRKAIAHGTKYGVPAQWRDTEIVLAGWSPSKDEPVAMVFVSVDGFEGREVTRFIRPAVGNLSIDPGNIAQSGLELMRAQRAATFMVYDGKVIGFTKCTVRRRVVHGFCQHTVVRRGHIETRVLERWPDA